MTIKVNGKEKRIGLSLSGGGFRAAGFHLGVFHKLSDLGLLWKIDLLSCVSGGSIAGAFLALRWGDDNALDDFEKLITNNTFDTSTILSGTLNPFKTSTDYLELKYINSLYGKKKLSDFSKKGPRIYLNSSNLSSGKLFFFAAGANATEDIGQSNEQLIKPSFSIARAVTASSAFPPWYKPINIDSNEIPFKEIKSVKLSDGGIYDNLGVNPLLSEKNQLDYCICSDAGMPFKLSSASFTIGFKILTRSISIMMENIRSKQFYLLHWKHKAYINDKKAEIKSPKPLWFSIDSVVGEEIDGDAKLSSSITTRFKKLSKKEITVLKRHGGALLEARLLKYAPELLREK